MKFKGRRVFVEVDGSNQPIVAGGRANMKYKLDDERTYNPNVSNLSLMDGTTLGEGVGGGSASAPKPAKRRGTSSPSSAKSKAVTHDTKGMEDAIIAYTDGACSGNPGPAGLGFSVVFPDGRRIQRGEPLGEGTNNIAELTAILRVLETVDDKAARLIIHTDSSYSLGVLTQGWKAKANQALIGKIKKALLPFTNLAFRKVKGHAGVPENELVDELARKSAELQEPVDY